MMIFSRVCSLAFLALLLAPSCFATKLVTYSFRGQVRLGAVADGHVIDLNRAYALMLQEQGTPRAEARAAALVPPEIVAFLEGEDASRQAALEAISFIRRISGNAERAARLERDGVRFTMEEVRLLAPIPNPPHLLAIGLNYRAHIEERDPTRGIGSDTAAGTDTYPIVFTKEGTVIGNGETIVIPSAVTQPDYEGELGVVIGKPARNVSMADALDYVAGYTVFNDVSARDYQDRVSQWTLGKSPDTFAVMGPYLVLDDEIPDPQTMKIQTRIGNELLQDSHTEMMIFPIARIISYISTVMTLTPGTVIATGTPSGVGSARTPPRWLEAGDTVTIEIEKVGTLSNPIARE